ncbi:MAG: flagellar hook-length control protein FliK [Planctomycetes bacterium]|nr:flagellar hook-length control protein FliK [Planctomycetota bacterium]
MDRLADITRPAPAQRPESSDSARQRPQRPERRDEGEVRPEERVRDRERASRSEEKSKPERFSVQLEGQKASLAKPEGAALEPEAQSTQADEASAARPENDTDKARTTDAKPTTPANDESAEPLLEPVQLELPAAAPSATPKAAPQAAQPAAPVAQLPTLDAAPLQTELAAAVVPKIAEAAPTRALTPSIESDAAHKEGESGVAKLGAARAEPSGAQTAAAGPKNEVPVEAPKVETPRAPAAAHAAHDVEKAADILRQLRVQITPQLQEARIQLHPLELGRVSIHIAMEDGRMRTTVRAERVETLNAIQSQLPELRASLRQSGIETQDFQLTLGFESSDRGSERRTPSGRDGGNKSAAETLVTEHTQQLRTALAKSGVDLYA